MAEAVQNIRETAVEPATELDEPRWAVISFERVEGGNLTYPDAERLRADLDARGIAGLCVVTDETAARIAA